MAVVNFRRTANLHFSVQAKWGSVLSVDTIVSDGAGGMTTTTLTVPVYHQDWTADPDSVRDPDGARVNRWVGLTWTADGAGHNGVSVLQVDVFTRIGAPGDAAGDHYGTIADDIADAILEPFQGRRANTSRKAEFPLLDYASDPTAPTESGECITMGDPAKRGGIGQYRSRTKAREGELYRITLLLIFRIARDRIPAYHYDE